MKNMWSEDGSNIHGQNVKDFLMCKRNIDLTSTEFYGNLKSNVELLKKMLGTNKYHGFVDKLNSVLFVVFSTIRLLQLVICQEYIDYGT